MEGLRGSHTEKDDFSLNIMNVMQKMLYLIISEFENHAQNVRARHQSEALLHWRRATRSCKHGG